MRRARRQRGFTLIEVMFAIAILAMAMTVVFSSNIIAARSTMHSRALTRSTMMARCRLTEAEAWLVVNQLPPDDKDLEDPPTTGDEPCCTDGVVCTAKVERIELPSPATVETAAGNQMLSSAVRSSSGSAFGGESGVQGGGAPSVGDGGTSSGSPLSALSGAMGLMNGGGIGGAGGSSGGTSGSGRGSGGGSGMPSPRDMASSLLTTVYPAVKPLLEGAIRRLTVTARWHEGEREQTLKIVEYVTNPGQTLPTAELLNGLPGGANSQTGGMTGTAASTQVNQTPSSGTPPTLRSP